MDFKRTPDERFLTLPDYQYPQNYAAIKTYDGTELRMHYVNEGDASGQPIVLLHGEPTWSYLYRKMIPVFAQQGFRVLVPDLIGFGRSDKPTNPEDYSYQNHLDWLTQWFDQQKINNSILFCQDWGGLLGLRLLADRMDRFSHVVVANTILPTGDIKPNDAFFQWRDFSQNIPELPVGKIISQGCKRLVTEAVQKAYDAPFPDESYKVGARRFPMLVPVTPDDPASQPNREAWQTLCTLTKPLLTLFSDGDPIMQGVEKIFQHKIPGAANQPHQIIKNAGHFLQEDAGEEIAQIVCQWVGSNLV